MSQDRDALRNTIFSAAHEAAVRLSPAFPWEFTPDGGDVISVASTPTSPPNDGTTLCEIQAVCWWLGRVRFTPLRSRDLPLNSGSSCDVRIPSATSYLELAMHVDIASSVNLGGTDADLAQKANRLVSALRHIAKGRNLRVNGEARTFAEAFKPASSPHLRLITGMWLPSISRCVCDRSNPSIHHIALVNVMRARSLLDSRLPDSTKLRATLLGKQYSAILPRNLPKPTWQPTQLETIHQLVQQAHDDLVRTPARLKCHFGHVAHNASKQNVFPIWRGAPLGATLCQPCYSHLQVDKKNHCDAISLPEPPRHQKKRRLGPCSLGHTTSSFNRQGLEIWFARPADASFRNLQPGSTLFWGCYRQFTAERHRTNCPHVRRRVSTRAHNKVLVRQANNAGTIDSAVTAPSIKRKRGDPPSRFPPPVSVITQPRLDDVTTLEAPVPSTNASCPQSSTPSVSAPKRPRRFILPSRTPPARPASHLSIHSRPSHGRQPLLLPAATARPPGLP